MLWGWVGSTAGASRSSLSPSHPLGCLGTDLGAEMQERGRSRCSHNPCPMARCGLLNCEVVLELLSRALQDPSDTVRMVSTARPRCVPALPVGCPVLPTPAQPRSPPAEVHGCHLLPHVLGPALPGPDLRRDAAAAAAAQPGQPRPCRQPSNKGDSWGVPMAPPQGSFQGLAFPSLEWFHVCPRAVGIVPLAQEQGAWRM